MCIYVCLKLSTINLEHQTWYTYDYNLEKQNKWLNRKCRCGIYLTKVWKLPHLYSGEQKKKLEFSASTVVFISCKIEPVLQPIDALWQSVDLFQVGAAHFLSYLSTYFVISPFQVFLYHYNLKRTLQCTIPEALLGDEKRWYLEIIENNLYWWIHHFLGHWDE